MLLGPGASFKNLFRFFGLLLQVMWPDGLVYARMVDLSQSTPILDEDTFLYLSVTIVNVTKDARIALQNKPVEHVPRYIKNVFNSQNCHCDGLEKSSLRHGPNET